MRVTDRMIFDQANRSTAAARERVEEASEQVSSGKRVNHPGDDPAAAALITSQRMAAARMESIQTVTGRATDEANVAWNSLNDLADVISRAKEITLEMGNDTNNAGERAAAANEMDSLVKRAAGILNTQFGNRYIFGGSKDNVPPFDSDGNYSGDTNAREIEIAPGVFEPTAVPAYLLARGGASDVFSTLSDISASLRANDGAAIRAGIGGLDQSLTAVTDSSAKIGSTAATLEMAQNISLGARDAATTEVANLGDADLAEAASNLAMANHALEAAITVSANSFQLSLVNKL